MNKNDYTNKMKEEDEVSIPLVKLSIENITYEPLTETYNSSSNTACCSARDTLLNLTQRLRRRKKQNDDNDHDDGNEDDNANTCTKKYDPVNPSSQQQRQRRHAVKRKAILKNVSPPPIEPFKLQAWLGPSGSGKTTLLSIASGAVDFERESDAFTDERSKITINNDPTNFITRKKKNGMNFGASGASSSSTSRSTSSSTSRAFPKGLIGVVWQDDLLLSNLTVRETIEFAAKLKTSSNNDHQVDAMVDQVLDDLSLTSIQHSLIGQSALGEGRGISGGERKRVSVAQELVTRPSLLFLDEPTSGLDSTSALELMTNLKNLAQKGGHSIVTVVHQPRTTIFGLMDDLLLLSKGEEVYSGPAAGAKNVLETCPMIGYTLPPQTNIADWIMDVIRHDEERLKNITARSRAVNNNKVLIHEDTDDIESFQQQHGNKTQYNDRCLPRHWMQTKSKIKNEKDKEIENSINTLPFSNTRLSTIAEIQSNLPKYMASFSTQLQLLTRRAVKQTRGERISKATLISQSAYLIFESVLWFRLKDDTNHIYERNSLIFFFIIAQSNGLVTQSVPIFRRDRALISRERSKKMYRVLPYYLSKSLAEMTTSIMLPLIHVMIVYWTANLRARVDAFLKFTLLFYLTLTSAQSIGFILSAALPSLQLALIITPTISIFFLILGGFYIPFSNMPVWASWIKWISFATYGYSGLLINEFSGRSIPCALDVGVSVGSTSLNECPQQGDDVLIALGITGWLSSLWFNVFMLIALQLGCRWGAYILLRRSP